jgi:putative FmdB family regulatory protein
MKGVQAVQLTVAAQVHRLPIWRSTMPLFEFRCKECGSRFEVLTSFEQSQGEMVCTNCHSKNVRKLVPLMAKRSKGGGDFGDDFGDVGDFGGDGDDGDMGGGSCGCGGACSCNN